MNTAGNSDGVQTEETVERKNSNSNGRNTASDSDWNLQKFSSIGIFGPDGFLASLDSPQQKEQSLSHPSAKTGSETSETLGTKLNADTVSDSVQIIDAQLETILERAIPPEEAVLSLDHVIELIFSKLSTKDLISSRLVSHRWAYYASKKLVKITTIQLQQSIGTIIIEPRRIVSLRGNRTTNMGSGNVYLGNSNVNSGNGNINVGNRNVNSGNRNINIGDRNVNSGNDNINLGNKNCNSGNNNVYSGDKNTNSGNNNISSGTGNVNSGKENSFSEKIGLSFTGLSWDQFGNPVKLELNQLTSTMNNPILGEFPCTSFQFNGGYLNNPETQCFFNAHGAHIKTLTFGKLPGFHLNFDDLKKLVLFQAINLEVLKLQGNVVLERLFDLDPSSSGPQSNTSKDCEIGVDVMQIPEGDYERIINLEVEKPGPCVTSNSKLKLLHITGDVPEKAFEEMLQLFPNLQRFELSARQFCDTNLTQMYAQKYPGRLIGYVVDNPLFNVLLVPPY